MNLNTVRNVLNSTLKTAHWKLLGLTSMTAVINTPHFDIEVSSKDQAIGRNFFFYGDY